MLELSTVSLLTSAVAAYLLLCVTSALAALIAWQGFRRLHDGAMREMAWTFVAVAVIQAALLWMRVAAVPSLVLRALDCASLAVMGSVFLGSMRRVFLVGGAAVCVAFGVFVSSLWQSAGAEPAWATPAWWLIRAAICGIVTLSLWIQRREYPLTLPAAFGLLMVSALVGAAGLAEWTFALRLVAFPLVLVALTQLSTRDLESVQSELRSLSEISLRQTQQLLVLLRASTAFLIQSDATAILREAVEGVALGLGADSVLIALLDDTPERTLRVQAVYPPFPLSRDGAFPLSSQPAIDSAVQLGEQVVLTASQRGIHALATLLGSDPGPAVVQPMLRQQRALGVIVAINGRSQRAFTESELRLLEAFGVQVAAATENALLDRLVEKQTRELAELLNAREEEAIRRAAMLESIADGVIVFDPDGRAILTNRAARAITNRSEADLLGKDLEEMMRGQVHQEDYAVIQVLVESEQPLPPGFKVTWGSQTVAINVAPVKLTAAGQHGTVMVLRDVTHEAEVDRMKSEFVKVVSHELRSPFATLDFSLQVIQKYGLEHLLPEQREQFQQVTEGLKRAQTMINNLITFAAFLSKQGQLQIALVDLGQVAWEVSRTLEPLALTRDIQMTLQIPDALPRVYGDRDRLAEAIYNLIHNAIKFNRQDGLVTVTCRATPKDVIVQVSDTGVGIPPEKLPEMWKDFAQLADPLRRGVEGLGLGLPLVKYVVKGHGGQVWARSQPGEGSVFGFSIPMAGRSA